MNSIPQRIYWPTAEWQTCEPQDVGFQSALLAQMQEHIDQHLPELHGLLIVHHGYLTFERYYQGFHQQSLNSISSATKSFISALVGVALAQGQLKRVDEHLLDFFPEIAALEQDSRKQAITLHHLLSFQTGFSVALSISV